MNHIEENAEQDQFRVYTPHPTKPLVENVVRVRLSSLKLLSKSGQFLTCVVGSSRKDDPEEIYEVQCIAFFSES